jgi:Mn2+/Fe2+ NRAMP family transporter
MARLFGPRYSRFRNLAWLFLAVAVILFVLAFVGIAGLALAVLQPLIILFVILFAIVLIVTFL